jgi:signal peptide peptidase SppA
MAKNLETNKPEGEGRPLAEIDHMALALDRNAAPRYAAAQQIEASAQRGLVVTRDGVAVIPINGFLSAHVFHTAYGTFGGKTRRIGQQVAEAAANSDVESIVLDVDSPGGSVEGITEVAAIIRSARERKPVTAVANNMAGSAAYWLASQATELVVSPSGEVGSIGVFMMHNDFSGYNERLGIKPTYIHAGANKVETNPDQPLSADALAHLQASVDEYYQQFTDDIARGRSVSADVVRSDRFGEGRAYPARQAVERGMADRIATIDEVVRAAVTAPARTVARRGEMAATNLLPRRSLFAFE